MWGRVLVPRAGCEAQLKVPVYELPDASSDHVKDPEKHGPTPASYHVPETLRWLLVKVPTSTPLSDHAP